MTDDSLSRQNLEVFLHEFGQPLTVLNLILEEIAPAAAAPPQLRSQLQTCAAAMAQMTQLYQEYRQRFSPPLSLREDSPTALTTFSVLPELHRLIRMLRYRAQREEVTLQLEEKSLKNFNLSGNPLHFRQIVGNFLLNAMDSQQNSRNFQRKVIISAEKADQSFILIIKDNGFGLPPHLVRTLGRQRRTSKPNGRGIGSILARTLLEEEFDGRLVVESQPQRGTTLHLHFPLPCAIIPLTSEDSAPFGQTPVARQENQR